LAGNTSTTLGIGLDRYLVGLVSADLELAVFNASSCDRWTISRRSLELESMAMGVALAAGPFADEQSTGGDVCVAISFSVQRPSILDWPDAGCGRLALLGVWLDLAGNVVAVGAHDSPVMKQVLGL
jgi:hypothetical protein